MLVVRNFVAQKNASSIRALWPEGVAALWDDSASNTQIAALCMGDNSGVLLQTNPMNVRACHDRFMHPKDLVSVSEVIARVSVGETAIVDFENEQGGSEGYVSMESIPGAWYIRH